MRNTGHETGGQQVPEQYNCELNAANLQKKGFLA